MGAVGGAALGTLGPSAAELLGFDPNDAWAATPIAPTDGVLINIVAPELAAQQLAATD